MVEHAPQNIVEVEFTEQQMELIERLAEEWRVPVVTAVARAVQEQVQNQYRDRAPSAE